MLNTGDEVIWQDSGFEGLCPCVAAIHVLMERTKPNLFSATCASVPVKQVNNLVYTAYPHLRQVARCGLLVVT